MGIASKNKSRGKKGNIFEDITPDDEQLSYRQSINAWNLVYRLMDNVKASMSHTKQGKKTIGADDVQNVVNYIKTSLDNIIKNTISPPQKPNSAQTNNNKQNIQNESKNQRNMKQVIHLHERNIRKIVAESVNRVLNESKHASRRMVK